MEIQNNLSAVETDYKPDSLLNKRINNFLINYFNYLTFFLAIMIFVVGMAWFVYPRYQQIFKSDETAMKNLQIEYDADNNYLSKIKNLNKSHQQVSQAERKKIEDMIPIDSKIINLIPEIESIILRNGAVLNSIKIDSDDINNQAKAAADIGKKPGPSQGIIGEQLPAGVRLVRIEVSLSSVSYQVLKNIIKTCENNLRLLDIAALNYIVENSDAAFTIYTYYLTS